MLFLPYKMDSEKSGLPLFTLSICFLCLFVFWKQYSEDAQHENAVKQFCFEELDRRHISLLQNVARTDSGNHCNSIFESIRQAENSDEKILELAKQAKPIGLFATSEDDFNYIHNRLDELFTQYDLSVPADLTTTLVYDPKNLNLLKMVTSTFSHADIFHLLGNLLFFYIFSISVELIVGSLVYLGFIAIVTLGTSLAYSYAMIGIENALPTLGLSGVVMATLSALAVMMPYAKIRCFFWAFIFFRVFRLPAILLALWYIGWDVYEMNKFGNASYINYVAHVSGAAMGAMLGVFYLLFRKDLLREAAQDY